MNVYSELISVSNEPPLGVTAQPQLPGFSYCNVAKEAAVYEL
jgi:hypothetical protein